MIGIILRLLWRAAVFALLLSLTYVTFFVAFPWLDRRLPFVVVVLLAYIAVAYFVLPTVIRFWRLVFKADHIPRYVTTGDGWPSDPVNIAVVARSKRHFIRSMRKAGWETADPLTFRNSLRTLYAIFARQPYARAPFSTLYLFGRPQDIGFQIATGPNGSPSLRHHVRFWQLQNLPGLKDDKHFEYWFDRVRHLFGRKGTIWIGAATEDVGIHAVRWRDLQFTHASDANHTKERDFIIRTLEARGLVKEISTFKDGEPFKLRSQSFGTTFIVDGYITVVELRSAVGARLAQSVARQDSP